MGMNKSIPVYSRIQRFIIIHLRYFLLILIKQLELFLKNAAAQMRKLEERYYVKLTALVDLFEIRDKDTISFLFIARTLSQKKHVLCLTRLTTLFLFFWIMHTSLNIFAKPFQITQVHKIKQIENDSHISDIRTPSWQAML